MLRELEECPLPEFVEQAQKIIDGWLPKGVVSLGWDHLICLADALLVLFDCL